MISGVGGAGWSGHSLLSLFILLSTSWLAGGLAGLRRIDGRSEGGGWREGSNE